MKPATGRAPIPVLALATLLLTAAVVAGPDAALTAARRGIDLWWTAVLPGLLPFFILSDLLGNLGVVRALGVLLEPIMRPVFNLPGAAGFALALGFTSGPPGGAKAATRLVSDGLCTPEEGARLAGFANAAGPLFVTGVTAVSLFRAPAAASHLAIAHYGAALLSGIILGRLAPTRVRTRDAGTRARRFRSLSRAWSELQASARTTPPLGHLLGSAVRQGVELILLVGGFIVLFSVVLGVVESQGLDRWVAMPLGWLFARLRLPASLATASVAGFLEVTSGVSRAATATGDLTARLTLASAILAWSGLSIHAQAAALMAGANLSYGRFLQGRLLQLVLSPLLFLALTALSPASARPALSPQLAPAAGPLSVLGWSSVAFALCLGCLLALSALVALLRYISEPARRRVTIIWLPPAPKGRS